MVSCELIAQVDYEPVFFSHDQEEGVQKGILFFEHRE
jgi:hypothetical protein